MPDRYQALRDGPYLCDGVTTRQLIHAAADHIAALRAENRRLREALRGLLNALPSATTHPAIGAARAALAIGGDDE